MSDDTTTADADVSPAATDDVDVAAPKPAPPKKSDDDADDKFERELTKLRAEAGRHRLEKKQALEASQVAQTQVTDLQKQLAATELTIAKYQAMVDAGIPTDAMPKVINLVNGHDFESIAESVAAAKELMGRSVREPAIDPAQGRGNAIALNSDELEHSLKRVLGIN